MTKTYAELMDQHRTDRRAVLLRIAADVIAEQGIRQTTMDHVAEAAGVAKMVFYRYFGAKDKLVHAILEEFVTELLEEDSKEADWWTQRVRRTLHLARANPSALKLLVRHAAHDPEYGCHMERLSGVLIARVEERLREIFSGNYSVPTDKPLLPESITAFFLDAYLRWIEYGSPEEDERFFAWVTKSVRAMSFYWMDLVPPANESETKFGEPPQDEPRQ